MIRRPFYLKKRILFLITPFILTALCLLPIFAAQPDEEILKPTRADLIIIDGLKSYGKLTRPAVPFLHDKHTRAVAKSGRDCLACHPATTEGLSLKFMRIKDEGKKEVMEIYHAECISCHRETKAEKKGPVACGECHKKSVDVIASQKPFGMDRSLHFRHVKTLNESCKTCHHVYDRNLKKLVYEKGKESTCRYCHKPVPDEKVVSMRSASHLTCVQCHRLRNDKKLSAGPVECMKCHDAQEQQLIKTAPEIKRLKLEQPDTLFITRPTKKDGTLKNVGLGLVAFNHKSHEKFNDTCRVCHHKELASCSNCHAAPGSEEKKITVNMASAMHSKGSEASCIGCHEKVKKKKECAGCHSVQKQTVSGSSCRLCHAVMPASLEIPKDLKKNSEAARLVTESRKFKKDLSILSRIPEKVKIGRIIDQYKAVDFPHRKIVNRLYQKIKSNRLAGYFHKDETTLCKGCHHNSPASENPPSCGSCHKTLSDKKVSGRPDLKAAYHIQCMSCHTAMNIKKPESTDCQACHLKQTVFDKPA